MAIICSAWQYNSAITHWGRVTHKCVSKPSILGSDNGLLPGRRQAIAWTNVGILLIGPLGTNFSEMLIKIHAFLFKKIHLKMSSGKWRPFCLDLNVLYHMSAVPEADRHKWFKRQMASWCCCDHVQLSWYGWLIWLLVTTTSDVSALLKHTSLHCFQIGIAG